MGISIRVMARGNTMRTYCKVGERFADNMESIFQHLVMDLHAPNKEPRPYPPLTPTAVSRLTVVWPLCFCAIGWMTLFSQNFLDCRSGSDETHPGVSRRNLN